MCVITPPSSCVLSGGSYSAAQARRFVQGAVCREHALEEACGDAVLLASELVAHSLTIGTRPTTLGIDCQVSRLEISLEASGHEFENPGAYPRLRTFLIEQLATGWGVEDVEHGRSYWCVLGTHSNVPAIWSP